MKIRMKYVNAKTHPFALTVIAEEPRVDRFVAGICAVHTFRVARLGVSLLPIDSIAVPLIRYYWKTNFFVISRIWSIGLWADLEGSVFISITLFFLEVFNLQCSVCLCYVSFRNIIMIFFKLVLYYIYLHKPLFPRNWKLGC